MVNNILNMVGKKMIKNKLQYMYILAVLAVIMPAHAEKNLPKVVTTKKLINEKDTSMVNSIKREDFTKQVNSFSVYDVLKRGVGISSSEKPGEKEVIKLRGLNQNYTRISVDGIELPSYGDENSRYFKVDIIPTPMIGEVKIINNASASYNADGIGGRIDMKTRKPTNKNTYSVDVSSGAMNSKYGHLTSLYVNKVISPTLKANFSISNSKYVNAKYETKLAIDSGSPDDYESDKDVVTQTKITTGVMGNLEKSYNRGTITFSPIYLKLNKIRDKNELNIAYDSSNGDTTVAKNEYDYREHPSLTAGLTIVNDHTFANNINLNTSISRVKTNFTKDKNEYEIDNKGVVETIAKTHSIEKQANTLTRLSSDMTKPYDDINTIKTGFVYRDNNHNRNIVVYKKGVLRPDEDKEEIYSLNEKYTAFYIQNEAKFKNGWTVLPGIRFEKIKRKGVTATETTNTSNQNFLPSIISNYKLNDTTNFTMAYSKKVNRPSYQQLVPSKKENSDDKEVKRGNPNLLAEKADTFDMGVTYNGGEYNLSANIFRRNIRDVIQEEINTGEKEEINSADYTVLRPENVGNGHVQGLELSQKFDVNFLKPIIPGTVSLDLNQTIMSSKLRKKDGSISIFNGQSDFIANSTIGWKYKRLYASISSKFEKGRTEVNGKKTTTIKGTNYVDVYAQYELNNGGAIYASVTNLFKQGYHSSVLKKKTTTVEKRKGYRSVWVGYKVSF